MLEKYSFKTEDAVGIADTIREVGKIEGKLIWPEGWKTAIRQLNGVTPQLIVTAPEGSTITAVNGEDSVTGLVGAEGTLTLDLPTFGTWKVTATLDGQVASSSIYAEQNHPVELSYITTFTIDGVPGEVVTAMEGETTLETVTLGEDGTGVMALNGVGRKTLAFTSNLSSFTRTVIMGVENEMSVKMYPDGALYWHGKEFEEKTGGWVSFSWQSSWWTGTGTMKKNNGRITLTAGSMKRIGARPENAINIPESVTTINANILTNINDRGNFGINTNKNYSPSANESPLCVEFEGTGIITLDASEISGDFYISLGASINEGTSTVEFDEVWLE